MSLTIGEIQRFIGERFGVSRQEMLGPRRIRRIARPRQIAMVLSREMTGASLPRIGQMFGGRDHTTPLHALREFEKWMVDPDFALVMLFVRSDLAAGNLAMPAPEPVQPPKPLPIAQVIKMPQPGPVRVSEASYRGMGA